MENLVSQSTTPLTIATAAVAVAVPTWILLKRTFRRSIIFSSTALSDVPRLSEPVTSAKHGTVVIAGGSLAGLLTARVCSAHFERVIVVEPEAWALSEEARHGPVFTGTREVVRDGVAYNVLTHKRSRIEQYTAIHGYQALSLKVLRELFPGFDDIAKSHGARIVPADFNMFLDGHCLPMPYPEYRKRGEPVPHNIFCTRRVLESIIRDAVYEQCPKVEYVNGTVTDIKLSDDSRVVSSAVVRLSDGSSSQMACDMFVDCTGVTQAGLKWLSRALPPTAAERLATIRQEYNPSVNYSSIDFPTPPGFAENLKKLEILAYPGTEKQRISFNTWFMNWTPLPPSNDTRTLFGGWREDGGVILGGGGPESETPVTLDQLREFSHAATIDGQNPPKFWFDILDLLEPVKDQAVAWDGKIRACSRISYEKVSDVLPSNFIALGDSTMRLNPRLGEGVTKCIIAATTLDGELRRHPRGPQDPKFVQSFFKLVGSRTDGIWDGERTSDYGNPSTTPAPGTSLKDGAFIRWYLKTLARVAVRDRDVSSVMWHSFLFLAPGIDILAPSLFRKVLWEYMFPSKPTGMVEV